MELNSLPNDCLLLLLDLFPVNVQAQLRAVCTRWKLLVERVWLKVNKINIKYDLYGIQRGFCIAFDNHEVSLIAYSGLERFVTREHFPGVTALNFDCSHVVVVFSDHEGLLPHCLAQWTDTLTDLTLKPFCGTSHEFQSSVWTQIDSMKPLKSLELHLPYYVGMPWKVPNNLSILANLEKFELDDGWFKDDFALAQLGPNLRFLNLQKNYSVDILMSILPKLISLTELSIETFKFPQKLLLDLFTSLSQLSRLSKLNLRIVEWNQFTSLNNLEYPKLTFVKHLSMLVDSPPLGLTPLWIDENIKPNPEDCFLRLNDFDRYFFATIPNMFKALEMIEVGLDFDEFDNQGFVDMFNDKLKLKFVKLREGKFSFIHLD